MKILNTNRLTRIFSKVFTLLFAFFILQSCGSSKYTFSTSSIVPAAEGTVKVKKDANSNYKIDLDVKRLAEASRLNPSRELYIVWMETEGNGRKNIGQLNTSSGFLSNTLKSSLSTTSSFKPIGFFITAEDNASVQYPSGQVVLTTGTN